MSHRHNQYCSFTVDPNLTRQAFGRRKSWSTRLDHVEIGLDKAVDPWGRTDVPDPRSDRA
jgi:hypothetical protein